MSKVLVLGAGGMLGHKLFQLLAVKNEVTGTVWRPVESYQHYGVFANGCLVDGVDVEDFETVERVMVKVQPRFVINCVGVVKQVEGASDPLLAIGINSLFPHKLAKLCQAMDARLIHVSTDCVFSGEKGMYKETDNPDARDLYGRTKLLGEVGGANCVTLRTSIIGRELQSKRGLLEWFLLPEHREVRGYRRAIYSGLTTIEFARVIEAVLDSSGQITGFYHVSGTPISKYDLLLLAREVFGRTVTVIPVDVPVIDRSLDSSRFRLAMGYRPPSWRRMMEELAADETPYAVWRGWR